MNAFFLSVVNMSISASWIVLAVLLLRLLLKKAPKWITVLLWGIVAIKLVCPFSIESVMSLIPSAQTISPEIMMANTPAINSGIPVINNVVNPVIGEAFSPNPGTSANPLQLLIPIMSIVWTVGIAGMLAYTVVSYFRVKKRIGTAVLLRENIFQSENVVSPFVLGIIKPKIYLPFNMHAQDMEYVIAHENAHIRRKDHLWKPFGFLVLTLHWFNPLIWLGYVLLCRDIELACDEKVVKELDAEQKADYSQALLTCSVNRRMIAACPLAFGEVGVKNRVKSVLNYKKPAFWIITVAIIASVVAAVCFLTDPVPSNKTQDQTETQDQIENLLKTEEYLISILKDNQPFYSDTNKVDVRISDYHRNIWQFAIVDLDSDNKNEIAVMFDDGSILILRKDGDIVTGFDFGLHAMYQINKDGSYMWNANAGYAYGCSKLYFSDNTCKTVNLWHVEHDEAGSVTYYVSDKAASQEAFQTASAKYSKESVAWTLWSDTQ